MKEALLVKTDIYEAKAKKAFQEATQGQNRHLTKFMT